MKTKRRDKEKEEITNKLAEYLLTLAPAKLKLLASLLDGFK